MLNKRNFHWMYNDWVVKNYVMMNPRQLQNDKMFVHRDVFDCNGKRWCLRIRLDHRIHQKQNLVDHEYDLMKLRFNLFIGRKDFFTNNNFLYIFPNKFRTRFMTKCDTNTTLNTLMKNKPTRTWNIIGMINSSSCISIYSSNLITRLKCNHLLSIWW